MIHYTLRFTYGRGKADRGKLDAYSDFDFFCFARRNDLDRAAYYNDKTGVGEQILYFEGEEVHRITIDRDQYLRFARLFSLQ